MDPRRFALVDALKIAALHPGEIRLYRRGKVPGVFAPTTQGAEFADEAVRDGLLEIVRVETVGKNVVEWVRITQKGLDFLLHAESPARALEELRAVLAVNEDGVPGWIADMQNQLDQMTRRFLTEVGQMHEQIDRLAKRANAAIAQIERSHLGDPTLTWAQDALDVLDGRKQVGLGERCALRDLFVALQQTHLNLTLREYHQGLKRLHDRGVVKLLPDVPSGEAPGPEYALLDGAAVYYYVARAK